MNQGAGSGFLIESKGSGSSYLVTNFHVVQGSLEPGTTNLLDGASITAVFPEHSDKPIPVKVVGANPSFDIALLTRQNLADSFPDVTGLTITDSDTVQVGQKVIAVGNPFGLEFTVTTGIVSAIGRFVPSVGQITIPMIQTDAAINPGNSGGPLLNSRGELIGINTSIINPEGRSSAGLGFAVPSNLLIEALANLELGGLSDVRDTRPTLGAELRTVSLLPERIRELLELPDEGVAVIGVLPGGPADNAGLRGSQRTVNLGSTEFPAGGDVITAVNGDRLTNAEELNLLVTYEGQAGDQLEFTLLRDGQELNVTVTLKILD
jgi:S1-C subfamily serine protease